MKVIKIRKAAITTIDGNRCFCFCNHHHPLCHIFTFYTFFTFFTFYTLYTFYTSYTSYTFFTFYTSYTSYTPLKERELSYIQSMIFSILPLSISGNTWQRWSSMRFLDCLGVRPSTMSLMGKRSGYIASGVQYLASPHP